MCENTQGCGARVRYATANLIAEPAVLFASPQVEGRAAGAEFQVRGKDAFATSVRISLLTS